jgi:hypothetical protein
LETLVEALERKFQPSPKKSKPVAARLPQEVFDQIVGLSKATGFSRSNIFEALVITGLQSIAD